MSPVPSYMAVTQALGSYLIEILSIYNMRFMNSIDKKHIWLDYLLTFLSMNDSSGR